MTYHSLRAHSSQFESTSTLYQPKSPVLRNNLPFLAIMILLTLNTTTNCNHYFLILPNITSQCPLQTRFHPLKPSVTHSEPLNTNCHLSGTHSHHYLPVLTNCHPKWRTLYRTFLWITTRSESSNNSLLNLEPSFLSVA